MNKMSEDEAIIFLKNIVKQNGDLDTHTTVPFYKKEAKAIETILDLYQQEKEKNEELSTIKEGIRVLQNSGLMDEQYIVIANWNLKNTSYKHLLDDYISKDKIRAKIKELEEKSDYWNCDEIEVLKELLEEE